MRKGKKKEKLSILDVVAKILDSDLPTSTRNEVTRYYMLPRLGRTQAIVENPKMDVGAVERPDSEEIEIENNPKLKAEYEETEKLMRGKEDEEEDE